MSAKLQFTTYEFKLLGTGKSINAKSLVPAVFLHYSTFSGRISVWPKELRGPGNLKEKKTYHNSLSVYVLAMHSFNKYLLSISYVSVVFKEQAETKHKMQSLCADAWYST